MRETTAKPKLEPQDVASSFFLGILVFLSRFLTRGPVYFVDGPRLTQCIQDRTFVIQPPGYWLYAHLGGIFRDPGFGLTFVNEIFSGLGVAVFFLLCRQFDLDRRISWAASLCYGSVFYLWFAGDIQSSYASQVLFPPLLVLLFLRYRNAPTPWRLFACACCFALGAGLRPSDGAFLAPLFIFLALNYVEEWRSRAWLVATAAVLCLTWYIPTQIASRAAHIVSLGTQLDLARPTSLFIAGLGSRSIANMLRVILPLFASFWMFAPAAFFSRSRLHNWMLALWIAPGLLFFFLVYMADSVYLTCFTAAIVLFVALSQREKPALALLLGCTVFNLCLFLGSRPLRGAGRADQAIDFYVVKYCDYGIRHQWISTVGRGGIIP